MKIALATAVTVVVAALAFWAFRANDPDSPAAATSPTGGKPSVSVHRRYGSDVVLAIKPGAPSASARATSLPKLSPLLQEYYDAKSFKPLYDRLGQATSRTAEETYVLAEILDRCAKVTDRVPLHNARPRNREEERKRFLATISDKDPDAQRRVAAYERVSSVRCEGLESLTTTEQQVRALLEQAASDPKARARLVEKDVATTLPPPGTNLSERGPKITDAQLDALRQAAQSNDPQVLMIAARVFGTTMQDFVVRMGPNDAAVDQRAFYDAWTLAACDAGYPCGPESMRLLSACANQGHCGAQDVRELLFFYDHSPRQSQRMNDYQAAITQAIRTGDWSAFNFHRGPGPQGWYSIYLQK